MTGRETTAYPPLGCADCGTTFTTATCPTCGYDRREERCGVSGGRGIGAGHDCRCNRHEGHVGWPLDPDRTHGCECGAIFAVSAPARETPPRGRS